VNRLAQDPFLPALGQFSAQRKQKIPRKYDDRW